MNFQRSALLVVVLAAVVLTAPGQNKTTLRFKVSARKLKNKDIFGTIDPFVMLYYTENESWNLFPLFSETRVGASRALSNTQNPDWPDVFTFEFDRYKRQRWHFYVYDHNVIQRNEKADDAWVSVSDYVDNGEYMQVKLKKRWLFDVQKGYLIIKKA